MKFNNFIIPLIAAGMMASCSDDTPVTPENSNLDGLYMTLTVSPQSMTRTSSPNTVTEAGQDDENTVSKLLLVLVDNEDKIVDYARVSGPTNITSADNGVTATGQFDRQRMINYLTGTHSDTKFYVICNPTEAQSFNIGETINDFICNKTPETYYSSNSFVMSNAEDVTVTLPTLDAVEAGNYNTPLTAYEIGNVKVERVAVRFDYTDHLDNDPDFTGTEGADGYYYTLAQAQENGGALRVSIKQLALCNIGRAFYLFKRVSDDGLKTDVDMFGPETKNNYVVDPYGEEKGNLKANSGADNFDKYFYDALFGKNTKLDFKDVSTIMAEGNKRGDANGTTVGNRYNFWRYALPSTLPANPTETQKNGNSTGVVFRAEITTPDTEESALKTAMTNGNILYAFGGKIIGNYKAIKDIVTKDAANEISVAFKNALSDEEQKVEIADEEINKKLVDKGFAIYRPENGKYYCDYYYWNRHNDNNKPLEMGAMEFGAVRNNIYKLVVTEISKLGHPTITTDDPDPIDPEDPDETSDFFMKVKVTVRPWGVRVNKIKF